MASSHNPFRTPAATPNPTGTSTVSSAGPASSDRTEERSVVSDSSVNDLLTEELPPAYTPSPNVYEGEATLELGPRRPFQQPQPVPSQPQSQFPPQTWGVPQQPTGASSWSNYPGQRSAPPVHPDLVRPSSTPPSHPVSDFARDFYAAGAGTSDLYGGSSAQYESNGASSSSDPRYAPPLPPRHGKGEPPSPNTVPDDGRPTSRPVPGHPLLRHGKVLVYPYGYECMKCECPPPGPHTHTARVLTESPRPKHRLQELRPLPPMHPLLGQIRPAIRRRDRLRPLVPSGPLLDAPAPAPKLPHAPVIAARSERVLVGPRTIGPFALRDDVEGGRVPWGVGSARRAHCGRGDAYESLSGPDGHREPGRGRVPPSVVGRLCSAGAAERDAADGGERGRLPPWGLEDRREAVLAVWGEGEDGFLHL